MSAHWQNTTYVYQKHGLNMDNMTAAGAAELIELLGSHFDMLVVQYGREDILSRITDNYLPGEADLPRAEQLADELVASSDWASAVEEVKEAFHDDPAWGYEVVCQPVHALMTKNGVSFQ